MKRRERWRQCSDVKSRGYLTESLAKFAGWELFVSADTSEKHGDLSDFLGCCSGQRQLLSGRGLRVTSHPGKHVAGMNSSCQRLESRI